MPTLPPTPLQGAKIGVQCLSMKRSFQVFLQIVLIAGIFGFLFWNAATTVNPDGKNIFTILYEQPKRWHFLAAAFLAQLFAVCLTIVRWYWLVRTLGLECSYREAFRLGFLGLMVTLAPLGGIGGDAVRAVLLAQKNPRHKSQAVASVIMDRILIGLFVMFLCCTFFIFLTGFAQRPEIVAKTYTHIVIVLTAVSLLGIAGTFLPFFVRGHFERLLEKIPLCGKLFGKLTQSLLLYRNHKRCLLWSCLITVFVHLSLGISFYWIALGLFSPMVPGLSAANHIMLHNVANLTSMIPLAAGPYEWVSDQLYHMLTQSVGMGLIVALTYRLLMICVTIAGMVYYYVSG